MGIDLKRGEIQTIIWATGFRPDYSWLHAPVLDRKGRVRHDGGMVLDAPGMYLMGMPFLRRRKSSLIDGASDDARDLSAYLAAYLDDRICMRTSPPRQVRAQWPSLGTCPSGRPWSLSTPASTKN